jgi:CubicO group peptidase (beta-lactamase class C family)
VQSSIRRWAVALLALTVLLAAAPGSGYAQPDRLNRIDDAVADRLRDTGTPGAALAVITGGEVSHTRTWGCDGDGEPVTADTAFLWGSVAKSVTGMAVMRAVEDGLLELDAAADEYLPWFTPSGETVPTVDQLLTNTSGISGNEDDDTAERYDNEPGAISRAARLLADVELTHPPGEHYDYASANYLLLGAVLESATGLRFEEYLRTIVLEPLGMDTAIAAAGDAADRLPPGHREIFGQQVAFQDPYDESGVPYGYLGGSLTDLSRFVLAELAGGELDGQRVLTAESVAASQQGRVDTGGSNEFGYGWLAGRLDSGEPTVWKGGATPGYQAVVVMLPDSGSAVIMLQNSYTAARDLQLLNAGFEAASLLVDAKPAPPEPAIGWLLALPWLLAGMTVLLLVVAGLSLRRAPRGQRAFRLRAIGWAVGAVAVSGLLVLAGPPLMGVGWSRLWIWSPDIGGALAALVAAVLLVGAARFRRLLTAGPRRT